MLHLVLFHFKGRNKFHRWKKFHICYEMLEVTLSVNLINHLLYLFLVNNHFIYFYHESDDEDDAKSCENYQRHYDVFEPKVFLGIIFYQEAQIWHRIVSFLWFICFCWKLVLSLTFDFRVFLILIWSQSSRWLCCLIVFCLNIRIWLPGF